MLRGLSFYINLKFNNIDSILWFRDFYIAVLKGSRRRHSHRSDASVCRINKWNKHIILFFKCFNRNEEQQWTKTQIVYHFHLTGFYNTNSNRTIKVSRHWYPASEWKVSFDSVYRTLHIFCIQNTTYIFYSILHSLHAFCPLNCTSFELFLPMYIIYIFALLVSISLKFLNEFFLLLPAPRCWIFLLFFFYLLFCSCDIDRSLVYISEMFLSYLLIINEIRLNFSILEFCCTLYLLNNGNKYHRFIHYLNICLITN